MKRAAAVCACVCIQAFWLNGGAQTPGLTSRGERVDEIVSHYTNDESFMGTVLVAEGDKVLLNKGYGFADLEWKIPMRPEAEFHLASVSKQFTAAAVLLLQEDNRLKLTEPIARYLPDAPKAWSSLTVENLLSHTSGLQDFTDDPRFAAWSMVPQTRTEQMAFLHEYGLHFKPDKKFEYCNTNYLLLAMIVEAASEMRFRDFLQQRIFDRLEMRHTGSDTDSLVLPYRAQGYSKEKGKWERVREVSFSDTAVDGGAGLYSNTADLLLWERALFGGKLLKPASLAYMTRHGMGDYGAGLNYDVHRGELMFDHSGAMQGFYTFLCYMPKQKVTVVVLSNRELKAKPVMVNQIVDSLLGVPVVLNDANGRGQ